MERSVPSLLLSVAVLCLMYILYSLGTAIYNITLHPLADIPGPKFRGAFYFAQYWDIFLGNTNENINRLHHRYGKAVRVTPSLVSFHTSTAWKDIHGFKPQLRSSLSRDPEVYVGMDNGDTTIIASNNTDHARIRRLLSHAFSENALRQQEEHVTYYLDLLIRQLYQRVNKPVDLVEWYNFTTFDILGDLCFGESFRALEHGRMHPWVATIFGTFKAARLLRIGGTYPVIKYALMALMKLFPGPVRAIEEHRAFVRDKVGRRLDKEAPERKDFMTYIQRHNDEKGMTRKEITATSGILTIAGSESTATLLSGATFFLLRNPRVMNKAIQEVRTAFSKPSEITFASVGVKLPYLNACLEETFRVYPPVPTMLPRKVEASGVTVDGYFIAPGNSVGIHPWTANRSATGWTDPDAFVPERWLGDEKYAGDDFAASQAFIIGPRACLGRSLAYAEGRSIMARMLWHFDMSLCDDAKNWDKQKIYFLWSKPALNIELKVRDGAFFEDRA